MGWPLAFWDERRYYLIMENRYCSICHVSKSLSDFGKDKRGPGGFDRRCKECVKLVNRVAYAKHAEKRRAYAVAYAAEHKTERREAAKAWVDENRDKRREYMKAYRATHKVNRPEGYKEAQAAAAKTRYAEDLDYREKVKAYAKTYRAENPEKVKAAVRTWTFGNLEHVRSYHKRYQRDRMARDPEYHQRCLDHQTMWRIRNWAKDTASDSWVRHVENQSIDFQYRAKLHIWQDGRCYICNRKTVEHTIEHIIPRSRGGPTIKQNLVYSCARCNYSKQAKIWGLEWLPDTVEADTESLLLRWRSIERALADAGLGGVLDESGGFRLATGLVPDRLFYVLSTFSCSERNPGSEDGRIARRIKENDPTAIVLFDREWYDRRSAVLNMLRSKMGVAERGPGARELRPADLPTHTLREFLGAHHVMGAVDAPVRVGLLAADGQVYGAGAFADRGDTWECSRLAFRGHVAGGMSRIVSHLWKTHGRRPVFSYVDVRYANGSGHESIGFEYLGVTPETYMWVLPDRIQHQRYLSNDNKMSRNLIFFDPTIDSARNIEANGIFKIWLPGRKKFLLPA